MRLVHLVGASAELKKFAGQIAKAKFAARIPMSRQLHAVIHRVCGRGDQILRSDRRGAVRELRGDCPAKNVPRFKTSFGSENVLVFGSGNQGQSLLG